MTEAEFNAQCDTLELTLMWIELEAARPDLMDAARLELLARLAVCYRIADQLEARAP